MCGLFRPLGDIAAEPLLLVALMVIVCPFKTTTLSVLPGTDAAGPDPSAFKVHELALFQFPPEVAERE
jgi:hypothetical protein